MQLSAYISLSFVDRCKRARCIIPLALSTDASERVYFSYLCRQMQVRAYISLIFVDRCKWAGGFRHWAKDKYFCWFVIYYVMTALKKADLLQATVTVMGMTSHLAISKLSEVLSAINLCRCYINSTSCRENTLNSFISLQNEVYARKVKQTKLSDFFKAELSSE